MRQEMSGYVMKCQDRQGNFWMRQEIRDASGNVGKRHFVGNPASMVTAS
jgi:hypothetical protein